MGGQRRLRGNDQLFSPLEDYTWYGLETVLVEGLLSVVCPFFFLVGWARLGYKIWRNWPNKKRVYFLAGILVVRVLFCV